MRRLPVTMMVLLLAAQAHPALSHARATKCRNVLLGWTSDGLRYAAWHHCRGGFSVNEVELFKLGSDTTTRICGRKTVKCPPSKAKILKLKKVRRLRLVPGKPKRAGWKTQVRKVGKMLRFYLVEGAVRFKVGDALAGRGWKLKGVSWGPKGKHVIFRIFTKASGERPENTRLHAFVAEREKCRDALLGWSPDGRSYVYRRTCSGEFKVNDVKLRKLGSDSATKICGEDAKKCPSSKAKILKLKKVRRLRLVQGTATRSGFKAQVRKVGSWLSFYLVKGTQRYKVGEQEAGRGWKLKGINWGPKGEGVLFWIFTKAKGEEPESTTIHGFSTRRM